jgi:hypothetical protein
MARVPLMRTAGGSILPSGALQCCRPLKRRPIVLDPIEIVVIEFLGNRFTGGILPALTELVDAGTISIIDALFVRKDADGSVTFSELDDLDADNDASKLVGIIDHLDSLLSEDDVAEIADGLENNSSTAILIFEHTWVNPLRAAVLASGGILLDSVRVPAAVVDEVRAFVLDTE